MLSRVFLIAFMLSLPPSAYAVEEKDSAWLRDPIAGPCVAVLLGVVLAGAAELWKGLTAPPKKAPVPSSEPASPFFSHGMDRARLNQDLVAAREALSEEQRKLLITEWFNKSETQTDFVRAIASEFDLAPGITEEIVEIMEQWLKESNAPLQYKARKPSIAFSLFTDAASWIALDQRIVTDLKVASEAQEVRVLGFLIDFIDFERDEELKEVRALAKKVVFESWFDAGKAKVSKELIEKKARWRIKFDRGVQRVF
jgi:hypothetical protein